MKMKMLNVRLLALLRIAIFFDITVSLLDFTV